MKQSIARIISRRILLLLLLATVILLSASFYLVSYIVENNSVHHSRTLVGVYADMVMYASDKMEIPVTVNNSGKVDIFGDYLCKWYSVDYATLLVPDTKNNKVKYISISQSQKVTDAVGHPTRPGDIADYTLSKEELDVWNGHESFASNVVDTSYGKELTSAYKISDGYGHTFLAVIGSSYADVFNQEKQGFLIVGLIILSVIFGIYLISYNVIKKKVSKPAAHISEVMSDYIHDGKFSNIKLGEGESKEFSMIADAYNKMSDEITAYLDNINQLTNEKTKQQAEIDIASKIQQGFLPKNTISDNDYYIQCMMQPAKNIGGDLYDYVKIDDHKTMLVIADVSGKGFTAALFMAVSLILIRQYAKQDLSPADILKQVNDTLSEKNPAMLFTTAFVGIYDSRTKEFTYANAGHNIPYVISDKLISLDQEPGTIIGLFPNEEYTNHKIQLHQGDTVFMYTDGVNEVINSKKEFYGLDRLEAELSKYINGGAQNIVEDIYKSISDFSEDAEQFDDITMLTLTVKDTIVLSLDYDIKEFEKIKELILQLPFPRQEQLNLCLAAEEIFANICNYAFPDGVPEGEKITFALSQADIIILRFEDGGVKYNPLENLLDQSDYDPDEQMGGLGIFITNNIVDDIRYNYDNNKNILSIIKKCVEEK